MTGTSEKAQLPALPLPDEIRGSRRPRGVVQMPWSSQSMVGFESFLDRERKERKAKVGMKPKRILPSARY